MVATEIPTCIISIKIVTHVFAAEMFTGISVAETSNCIIDTKTVTFVNAIKRSTNISVAESTNNIIAIEPQNLHNCHKNCHPHICCRNFTGISVTETSNHIIATETIIFITATKRSTNIGVTESTTNNCKRKSKPA